VSAGRWRLSEPSVGAQRTDPAAAERLPPNKERGKFYMFDTERQPRIARDHFSEQRTRMIEEQLQARGIWQPGVLDAMAAVPREEFVPFRYREVAYNDSPLPIGFGQTISQPYTVAFMCQAADLDGTEERVLEVGTGSGYGAAVLSHLAREIYSVERIPELAKQAESRLRRLGFENVHVRIANGSIGLPKESPFDAIIVTAAAEELPPAYLDQLADGGRIIIPIGRSAPHLQTLFRFKLAGGTVTSDRLGSFTFVPLIREYGSDGKDQYEFDQFGSSPTSRGT
jgi:protein-L-isoaspartate(D-aspartate) O-methyltransferase